MMEKAKAGAVIQIDHKVYGKYGVVTRKRKDNNLVYSHTGYNLLYDDEDLAKFPVIGMIKIAKRYGDSAGWKFASIECGQKRTTVLTQPGGMSVALKYDDVRIMGFLNLFPAEVTNEPAS